MYQFAIARRITVLSLLIFANSLTYIAQTDSIYRLPVGTRITLKLDAEINSRVSSLNDTFLATVSKPVTVRDSVVVPAGTVIEGRVSSVSKASGFGRDGKLNLVFERMKISGQSRNIDGAMITNINIPSGQTGNILSVLGGTVAGLAIGSASHTSNSILIGAGIGAAAGTGIAMIRKGKDSRLRKGEEFEIELKKEVLLPVLDY